MTLEDFAKTKEGQKFFTKVHKTENCWLWTAGQMCGYGWLRDPFTKKNTRAHQFIMKALLGLPKTGFETCHKCNVKLCVNPQHLYYGTRRDNIRDQVAAGVHNFLNHGKSGTKSPKAILTVKQVREIRKLRKSGLTYRLISEKMNLNISTVGNVINNNRYLSVK